MSALPKTATIIEVGPRDGLQNEKQPISLSDKLKFINLLTDAGFPEIEAGSFVSPKWVPQMADSESIFKDLAARTQTNTVYTALVPNEKGLQTALACGVKKIAVFTAASESFNQKNINCSIEESIKRFEPVVRSAQSAGVMVRGYVSTAFVCPYEGPIRVQKVTEVVDRLMALGIHDISLGDTIGKATPIMIAQLLDILLKGRQALLAMHFHDTYGTAIANVSESLRFGINRFDSSAAGLGGCPYAVGASGNVATDDLVWFLENMGVSTGIDRGKLNLASLFIQNCLQKQLPSRLLRVNTP